MEKTLKKPRIGLQSKNIICNAWGQKFLKCRDVVQFYRYFLVVCLLWNMARLCIQNNQDGGLSRRTPPLLPPPPTPPPKKKIS